MNAQQRIEITAAGQRALLLAALDRIAAQQSKAEGK